MAELISREVDYAIRIVAYLAGQKEKVKIKDICDKLYISKPIAIKIINKLKKNNILTTLTGKNGGIELNTDVEKLSLYDILSYMEYVPVFNVCVDKPSICKLNPICKITTFFKEIQDKIVYNLLEAKVKDFIFKDEDLEKV